MTKLRDMFVAHLSEPLADEETDCEQSAAVLAEGLEQALDKARAEWPDFELDDAVFMRHVAERIPSGIPAAEALQQLRIEDLFLTCACLHGDKHALEAFRNTFVPRIRAAVGRMASSAVIEEVTQDVLKKLLVGDEQRKPAIAQYAGRGHIAVWVRVTALRAAQRSVDKERKRQAESGDQQVLERAAAIKDPELLRLKEMCGGHFKSAFQRAFANLSARERNILRYELRHGMNIDAIGKLYDVHRSTVARWRAACRATLLKQTRDILIRELKLSSSDCDSLIRFVRSQLDMSLTRLLQSETEAPS